MIVLCVVVAVAFAVLSRHASFACTWTASALRPCQARQWFAASASLLVLLGRHVVALFGASSSSSSSIIKRASNNNKQQGRADGPVYSRRSLLRATAFVKPERRRTTTTTTRTTQYTRAHAADCERGARMRTLSAHEQTGHTSALRERPQSGACRGDHTRAIACHSTTSATCQCQCLHTVCVLNRNNYKKQSATTTSVMQRVSRRLDIRTQ